MPDERKELIEAIQASGHRACLVASGGGTGAIHALLSHPGASRFVLEAQVPYSVRAMFDYLGEQPGSACSPEAAKTMAGRAYERALVFTLAEGIVPIMGIACTAALQTSRQRRGADRAWFGVRTRTAEQVRLLELEPAPRLEQEAAVSDAWLLFIGECMGIAP